MRKGEKTRNYILEEALATASRIGLEGLSIGTLARQVGMSKSGLFAHFDSKENLQRQVLECAVQRFIRKVITPAVELPRGEPRVRALFDNWLTWARARFLPGGCPFISAACELDDRPGVLRDALVDGQQRWLDTLARAAQTAVEAGHFRDDLDTRQFAYDVYSIMLAHHHFARLLRDPETERRARRSFEQLLQTSRSRS